MPVFYGVILDQNNRFLKRNLGRLEKRFKERYFSSLEKKEERELLNKNQHKTVLKSIEDNKKRLLQVRLIRFYLFQATYD